MDDNCHTLYWMLRAVTVIEKFVLWKLEVNTTISLRMLLPLFLIVHDVCLPLSYPNTSHIPKKKRRRKLKKGGKIIIRSSEKCSREKQRKNIWMLWKRNGNVDEEC